MMHAMGNYPIAAVLAADDGSTQSGSQDAEDVDPWPTTSLNAVVSSETFGLRTDWFVRNSCRYEVSPKMIRTALELQFRFFNLFGMPVKKNLKPLNNPVRMHATPFSHLLNISLLTAYTRTH